MNGRVVSWEVELMSETKETEEPKFSPTHECVNATHCLELAVQPDGTFADVAGKRYTRAYLDRQGTLKRIIPE